ncbi:hypothetical protein QBC35DRAFT_507474 [Podospora australis]|uniref:Secreted protein n=1 Tax=Podospora australis TaxID=1536484 RepID=A0AAN6WLT5_9PEZI|nr:hypothetical protein QBC35DRAFT_507474 [Podospora australis]
MSLLSIWFAVPFTASVIPAAGAIPKRGQNLHVVHEGSFCTFRFVRGTAPCYPFSLFGTLHQRQASDGIGF